MSKLVWSVPRRVAVALLSAVAVMLVMAVAVQAQPLAVGLVVKHSGPKITVRISSVTGASCRLKVSTSDSSAVFTAGTIGARGSVTLKLRASTNGPGGYWTFKATCARNGLRVSVQQRSVLFPHGHGRGSVGLSRTSPVWPSLPGQLDVFGQGHGGTLEHYYYKLGGGWHAENLGGSLASAPAAVFENGQLDVFGRARNGGLEHYYYKSGAWHVENLGGSLASAPAVLFENGRLDVFAEARGATLEHYWYLSGIGWSVQNLGGSLVSAPAATVGIESLLQGGESEAQVDVFGEARGGTLEHYYFNPGRRWRVQNLGGRLASAPAVPASYEIHVNQTLDVFGQAPNGTLEHYYFYTEGKMGPMGLSTPGWQIQNLGGSLASAPTVVSDDDQLDVFGQARGGTLEHYYYKFGGSGWHSENLGGSLASAPEAVFENNQLDVFGSAPGGTLEHYFYKFGGRGWHRENLGGKLG